MRRWLCLAAIAGCRIGFNEQPTGDGGGVTADTVDGMISTCAVRLGAGRVHITAILPDATLRVWGDNAYGQIGDGFMIDRNLPTPITMPANVVSSAAGRYETCVALATGQVRCWGEGDSGQLGDGNGATTSTPVIVSNLTNAIEVATAAIHACARLSSGEVWCWGAGSSGRLGTGGTASSLVPVKVMGISTAKRIDSGGSTTCATLADNTLRCWGYNQTGCVGNNTMTDVLTPTEPMNIGTVRSVSSRDRTTCAARSDGEVFCWGANEVGQAGSTIAGNLLIPTPVRTMDNSQLGGADEVAQGIEHGCARLGGAVWCWGSNMQGQLGDGNVGNGRAYAAPVLGLPPVVSLAVAAWTNCALDLDGAVWCWGQGANGELGNGSSPANQPNPSVSFTGC